MNSREQTILQYFFLLYIFCDDKLLILIFLFNFVPNSLSLDKSLDDFQHVITKSYATSLLITSQFIIGF